MKNLTAMISCVMIVMCWPLTASAQTNPQYLAGKLNSVLEDIGNEMVPYNYQNGSVSVQVSGMGISVDEDELRDALNEQEYMLVMGLDEDELNSMLLEAYQREYRAFERGIVVAAGSTERENSVSRATESRKGSVWCGLPAGGWGYIDIYYNVSYSNNQFTSASVTNSEKSGITIFEWTHRSGYVEYEDNNATVFVVAEGSLQAGFDINLIIMGQPVTIPAHVSYPTSFGYFDREPW